MRWLQFAVIVVALMVLSVAEKTVWTKPVFVLVGVAAGFLRGASFGFGRRCDHGEGEDEL